ncbi:hypothetical protein CEXT_431581 [Caerostris extrusa]|uniref:Uncharacterized protein n=1 Tax=Caerostris extrusa TaxID=172846 RepID=A0AAV4NE16_CAEEX|nr:hypothetical protein CEXT_431581 [Caerostris extrusa]
MTVERQAEHLQRDLLSKYCPVWDLVSLGNDDHSFKSLVSCYKDYFSSSEEYNHEVLHMRNSFGVADHLLRGGLLIFVLNDG